MLSGKGNMHPMIIDQVYVLKADTYIGGIAVLLQLSAEEFALA